MRASRIIVKQPWIVAACCSLLLSCASSEDSPEKDSPPADGRTEGEHSVPPSSASDQPADGIASTPDGQATGSATNRLIHEKSPYLLQHAHNPVDWYPWGEEAFARARRENKPIFLSIGYSTCHWCHVMAHESFEDPQVAAVLNKDFISIKLDREERPDIDRIYMSFVQATTRRGGWPLNVFLTPDLKPFFGGTYFPRKRAGNRPGFIELLNVVTEKWNTENDNLVQSANQIVDQLRAQARLQDQSPAGGTPLSANFFAAAYEQLEERFDDVHGGFGNAPKFPRPVELLFLHRQFARTGNAKALDMSLRTLDAMARGGIHDQLAGGFHRYSTDAFWREPHFEKMLYDQAQLVVAYLEAYQLTGEERFADHARTTLDYVARDMRDPDGGFYSAEDADSAPDRSDPHHKIEGAFYVWSHAELDALLPPELMQLVVNYYGVAPGGNLRAGELRGKNALYIDAPLATIADSMGIDPSEAQSRLARLHETLLRERARRLRPHLDDKVITSWNGLMITAFARAAQILHDDSYQQVAEKAATFVLNELWDKKSEQLQRRWRLGDAGIPGFNVDYAYLAQGMLDLYETTFDYRWLQWARQLTDRQIALFNDIDAGAFFEVTDEDSTVLIRSKERYDGAQPTSNSITALNLLRLGEMTDSQQYRALAQQVLQFYSTALQVSPLALPSMLIALDWKLGTKQQIIIAGEAGKSDTEQLLGVVHEKFLPHKILLLADGKEGQKRLVADLPFMATMTQKGDAATAFVCQDYACQLPVTDAQALAKQLKPTY